MRRDLIAHGRSMVQRLQEQLHAGEPPDYPDDKKVAIGEADDWIAAVRRFIGEQGSDYAKRRVERAYERWNNAVSASRGTELERSHRFMAELLDIVATSSSGTSMPMAEASSNGLGGSSARRDLFFSHASEDKDTVVRPLVDALQARGLSAWVDEGAVVLGDSLRRSIEDGLANSRMSVVIISPAFLAKEWPQRELDALVARETITGKKVILPVLHGVDERTLVEKVAMLADRRFCSTSAGLDRVADLIVDAFEKATRAELGAGGGT